MKSNYRDQEVGALGGGLMSGIVQVHATGLTEISNPRKL